MLARVITYGLVVAVLTGLGIWGSNFFFGEEAQKAIPRAVAPAQARSEHRADGGQDAGGSGPRVQEIADDLTVLSVSGNAEHQPDGATDWTVLEEGALLKGRQILKTGGDSRLTLGVGNKSRVELDERAELRLKDITSQGHQFQLIEGRISVDYKEQGRRVRIENRDGTAVAEAEEGIFTVLGTGTTVAVATKTGRVDLSAGGQTVEVAAGQQSVVEQGGVPAAPRPIPVDVMLRVVDPGCLVQRNAFLVVKGRADEGSRVTVDGEDVELGPDGNFAKGVGLKVGKNRIVIEAVDASGNQKRKVLPCVIVDPGAPIEKVDIKWGPSS